MASYWPFGYLSPKLWAKEGLGSNWQFDSRPLKIGNRPLPEVWIGHAIRRWKDLDEGYNFVETLLRSNFAVGSYGRSKFRESRRDDFGTTSGLHFGSPGNLCHLGVVPTTWRRVYYREYGGGILPSQGCGDSKWVRVPVACPNTKRVQMDSNQLVLVCDAGSCDLKAWSLPSLIPGLPTRPSTPF